MRRIICATAVTLLAVGLLPTASAQSLTMTVDCNRGQTIANALKQGDSRKPLVVIVRGTCDEFVRIVRDDVTLRADSKVGGTVNGPNSSGDTIVITASRTTIDGLTVTGGGIGIRLQSVFNASVNNSMVRDTAGDGIVVRAGDLALNNTTIERSGSRGLVLGRGASVRVVNSQFLNNPGDGVVIDTHSVLDATRATVSGNGAIGLNVARNSSASITATTISGNGTGAGPQGDGILLWGGAQAHIVGDNVIIDNRDEGINVEGAASAYIFGGEIARNGGDGILGYLGANLVLGDLTIENNGAVGVSCRADCTAQMENLSIHQNAGDGIQLSFDSTLMLIESSTDVTGNGGWGLNCHDAESSVSDTALLIGPISPNCSGFD